MPLLSKRYTKIESQSSKHVMREAWRTELKGLIASEKTADVTQLVGEEQRGGGKKREQCVERVGEDPGTKVVQSIQELKFFGLQSTCYHGSR